ncbi:carbonate dehydratase [Mycobacterium shigaense]|uniref:Cation-transporting P-type ATPase B n=2 Tax=Mycobacterium shigaense TaxID=722731 RepID=A0A1Z4EBK9_9MYCO|nr:carbonate dehydratase [Mycobacterium shigaense]
MTTSEHARPHRGPHAGTMFRVTASPAEQSSVKLDIAGMSCASCAAHIQEKLNKLDGVNASVNYATETATVTVPSGFDPRVLVAEVEKAGYTAALPRRRAESAAKAATDDPELASLRTRLIAAAVLATPVIAMAMIPALQFRYWQWVSLALAAPVVLWAGRPFHAAAWANLRHRAATMDTLISIGTLSAFGWSLYALFLGTAGKASTHHHFHLTAGRSTGAGNIYLEVAAGVTLFVLAGRYFERRAKRRAGAALRALFELGAKDVAVLRPDILRPGTPGVEIRIPIDQLRVGDEFVVRPGEKIATDGVVVSGSSAIDAALLTGESTPIEVGPDDAVTGATVNVGGRLTVRATRVGAETQLAQMAALVEAAQAGKADVQRLADRVSGVFVPIVIAIALATLAGWLLAGFALTAAMTAAVAVLIIACPCALGLATPTALLVGTGRAAQLGVLIKGPEVLESTRRVDTIVLDKTGTITTGRMTLVGVITAADTDRETLLRYAGGLEDASEHPVARAIAKGARSELGSLPTSEDFANAESQGVQGIIEGHRVIVGRQPSVALPKALSEAKVRAEAEGKTAVAVGWDGIARGILVIADSVKPTSAEAIRQFERLGLTPVLLTGDNDTVARRIADEVGITRVIAEVLPAGKVAAVKRLQADGRVVAMVGDGVNDAAALATADLGLAMGTGTDAAIQAADLTLVRGDLRAAADAIRLSRRTLATIKANLFWAFGYNVAAIPLAALGLLNPMLAGAAMAFSSFFVVANSLRLRSFASLTTPGDVG